MYILCVMGNPIEQSLSPWIHAQFAKQLNLEVQYTKIKPEIGEFQAAVEKFRKDGGHGFNITLPFKEEAFKITTQLSPRAAVAKAVNTILFMPDGEIFGDNTDGVGLIRDMTQNLNYSLAEKIIVIFGAGGAVRGILHPLLLQKPKKIIIANRTISKAQQLAAEFQSYGNVSGCGFADLHSLQADVVIDGTGFNAEVTIPETFSLSSSSLCYDLKYNHAPTPFMRWAESKSSTIISNGLGMLVEQAAEAFFIWTGKRPETRSVSTLLYATLP